MEIQIERQGGVAIVQCHGSLDVGTIPQFKRATQECCERGVKQFVLDGSALHFVDSMGLGALISLMRRVREQGGEVKIARLSADVRSIFEITRLHRLFDICETTVEACRKFQPSE